MSGWRHLRWALESCGSWQEYLLPGPESETPVFTALLHLPDLPTCGSYIGEMGSRQESGRKFMASFHGTPLALRISKHCVKQVASLLAYQKIMSYKQIYEVPAQGDQCGPAVGQQEIKKKKKMRMFVWICMW